MVGYATQDFEADIVKWSFNLSVPVPLNGLNDGYRKMKNKLDTFKKIWESKSIEVDEFQIRPVSVQKSYGEYGKISGYSVEQNLYIISKNIFQKPLAPSPFPAVSSVALLGVGGKHH